MEDKSSFKINKKRLNLKEPPAETANAKNKDIKIEKGTTASSKQESHEFMKNVEADAVRQRKFIKKQYHIGDGHVYHGHSYSSDVNSASAEKVAAKQNGQLSEISTENVLEADAVQHDYIGTDDIANLSTIAEDFGRKGEDEVSSGSTHVIFADRVAKENKTILNNTEFRNNMTAIESIADEKDGKLLSTHHRIYLLLI